MALIECAQFYRCPPQQADACPWRSTVTRTGGVCPNPPERAETRSLMREKEEEKPIEMIAATS